MTAWKIEARKFRIAEDPGTPAEILKPLLADDDPLMRSVVAAHPNLTADILEEALARERNSAVYGKIFEHPNFTPEMQKRVREEQNRKRRVAENPDTPAETLKALLADNNVSLRLTVLMHSNITTETLDEAFTTEEDFSVRISIVGHRKAGPALLEKAFNDLEGAYDKAHVYHDGPPCNLRSVAVSNPNVPFFIMEKAIEDSCVDVRCAVAGNPKTPQEFLMLAAEDKKRDVRLEVSRNPSAAAEILLKTIRDEEGDVRRWAAQNPNTPTDALFEAASDEAGGVRLGVAENQNTPREALVLLLFDENQAVSQTAARNWKSRGFDQVPDAALPPPDVPTRRRGMRL